MVRDSTLSYGTDAPSVTESGLGTLMHPAVIKRVLGNDASHLQAAPAVLTVRSLFDFFK